jgi:hypothetical protein
MDENDNDALTFVEMLLRQHGGCRAVSGLEFGPCTPSVLTARVEFEPGHVARAQVFYAPQGSADSADSSLDQLSELYVQHLRQLTLLNKAKPRLRDMLVVPGLAFPVLLLEDDCKYSLKRVMNSLQGCYQQRFLLAKSLFDTVKVAATQGLNLGRLTTDRFMVVDDGQQTVKLCWPDFNQPESSSFLGLQGLELELFCLGLICCELLFHAPGLELGLVQDYLAARSWDPFFSLATFLKAEPRAKEPDEAAHTILCLCLRPRDCLASLGIFNPADWQDTIISLLESLFANRPPGPAGPGQQESEAQPQQVELEDLTPPKLVRNRANWMPVEAERVIDLLHNCGMQSLSQKASHVLSLECARLVEPGSVASLLLMLWFPKQADRLAVSKASGLCEVVKDVLPALRNKELLFWCLKSLC